jgi:hypothetical protein
MRNAGAKSQLRPLRRAEIVRGPNTSRSRSDVPLLNAMGRRASVAAMTIAALAGAGCTTRSAVDWPATSAARPVSIDRARVTRIDGTVFEMEDVTVTRDSVAGSVAFAGGAARLGLARAEVRSLEREAGLGRGGLLGAGVVTVAIGIAFLISIIANNTN